jgi:hypothetical protein
MPKFFFDIWDHNAFVPDPDGADLPDLAEVRKQAASDAREILSDGRANGEDRGGWIFDIKDGESRTVLRSRLSDLLREEGGASSTTRAA